MSEARSDQLNSILLALLIHAAIVGALLWGWFEHSSPKPQPQVLAIEATVVHGQPSSAPAPPAPPAPPPPAPTPDLEAQQRAAEQKAEEAKKAQEQKKADELRQQEADRKAAADAAAKAEAAAKAKAEAEQKAREEAEAKVKAAAAAAAKADADRKAQQLAQQRRAEQDQLTQRESDLRAQMQAEEHLDAARSNGALAQYQAMIAARIERAWIRPPSAHPGISCRVHITQVPGGVVTAVQVTSCNGDDAVRQSIADAAYRASPLPAPSDPALFDRDVIVTFAPHD